MRATLLFLILWIPVNVFAQTQDHVITVDRDTITNIKIKSNPYYTNKNQVTLKDGRVFQSDQIISYTDDTEYFTPRLYEENEILMRHINIGPYRIFIARNSDESIDTFLYKEGTLYALDTDNLETSLKSKLDSVWQFEQNYDRKIPSKIKKPVQAAEYLASYNSYKYPNKYKPAKFKRLSDLISVEFGLGVQYNTIDQPSFELASTSQVTAVPQFGLRANYDILAFGFDVEYINSNIGNEDVQTNLKTLPVSFLVNIRLLHSSTHSIYLTGGILSPFNMGTEVKSVIRNNGPASSVTYDVQLQSAPFLGASYSYKNSKNQRFSLSYRYFKSEINVEKPKVLNFAPDTINMTSNTLKLSYIVFVR